MCNLYSIATNQAAIIALFRVVNRYVGNLAPMPGVFPDFKAPIVRAGADGRELTTARWGMPSSSKALMDATKKRAEKKLRAKGKQVDFKELLRMEPDGGTTNIRNVKSKHWSRWLGSENRCVVPFNSFSEFNNRGRRHLVRARRNPPAGLLRRHLDQLDLRPEGQRERDHQRYLRVPHDGGERRGRRHPPQGDARDPDDPRPRSRPG